MKTAPEEYISIHAPPRGATSALSNGGYEYRFQFTPLREGRRQCSTSMMLFAEFQFTPLREGRLFPNSRICQKSYFNSRPSARGDAAAESILRVVRISIHAPPRGATACSLPRLRQHRFQFTPLREGRPSRPASFSPCIISIHAPPRGATPAN